MNNVNKNANSHARTHTRTGRRRHSFFGVDGRYTNTRARRFVCQDKRYARMAAPAGDHCASARARSQHSNACNARASTCLLTRALPMAAVATRKEYPSDTQAWLAGWLQRIEFTTRRRIALQREMRVCQQYNERLDHSLLLQRARARQLCAIMCDAMSAKTRTHHNFVPIESEFGTRT